MFVVLQGPWTGSEGGSARVYVNGWSSRREDPSEKRPLRSTIFGTGGVLVGQSPGQGTPSKKTGVPNSHFIGFFIWSHSLPLPSGGSLYINVNYPLRKFCAIKLGFLTELTILKVHGTIRFSPLTKPNPFEEPPKCVRGITRTNKDDEPLRAGV